MMECEHDKMNNYAEINPYYLIYCNMNIKVHEEITKEAAENVVRQIGYLHNAMGFVFKDLIKILSYKFPVSEPVVIDRSSKISPCVSRPQNTNVRQCMDIEFEHEPRVPKQKQRSMVEEKNNMSEAMRREEAERVEHFDIEAEKPPNSNIFDQYAYGKEATEPKVKDKNSLKLGVVRIIEEVKKKKGEAKVENRQRGQPEPKKLNIRSSPKEKGDRKEPNPMREFIDKPINQEGDIFGEFAFNKPSPIKSTSREQPVPVAAMGNGGNRNDQYEENLMQQFLKQKDEPPIYQISDDEQAQ